MMNESGMNMQFYNIDLQKRSSSMHLLVLHSFTQGCNRFLFWSKALQSSFSQNNNIHNIGLNFNTSLTFSVGTLKPYFLHFNKLVFQTFFLYLCLSDFLLHVSLSACLCYSICLFVGFFIILLLALMDSLSLLKEFIGS